MAGLTIHEAAHKLGMHSNATMLYGHIEKYEHRIDHMEKVENCRIKQMASILLFRLNSAIRIMI